MNTGRASINDGGGQVHFLPFPAPDLLLVDERMELKVRQPITLLERPV
jgi:hypothetical protein